ncbi:MAG: FtsQ-type POTRA domain-containing protein [Candidatus Cloacimonetes bacterium]|nr:FtsQ-type POTRA domain-containing protein [Candidatus Cloacimonadota bacterium]
MQENRTRKKEPVIRKALIMLVLCVSISGAGAYLLKFGVTKWSYLEMKDSEVTGTVHINSDLIHIALSVFKGENLYLLDDEIVRTTLLKNPRIQDVRLLRIFPNTLKVIIQERLPIAYLQTQNDEYYIIDEERVLLEKVNPPSTCNIPVFCDIDLNNLTPGQQCSDKNFKTLIDVYGIIKAKFPEFLACVNEFYMDDDDVVISENEGGVRFIIGDRDFDERLEKLVFAYQNYVVATYSEIDVRFSDPIHELVILR